MKTMIKNTAILLFAGFIFTFFSCENPIALGGMLDVNGPVINITAPAPRKAVNTYFTLEGNASDATGVKTILVKASLDRIDIPTQWRYNSGSWEISDNYGASWTPYSNAKWTGDTKRGNWEIEIDMGYADDGEYVFSVQGWDTSGFSDDNSFKTIVLIIDKDPPKVSVSNPYLYDRTVRYSSDFDEFTDSSGNLLSNFELNDLHAILDESDDWRDPALLGRFQTQGFLMQWQIEDNHDIWSFDLRFYDVTEVQGVDEDPDTALPDNYIYMYSQNLGPPPDTPQPESYLKPNGSVNVPALDGDLGNGLRKKVEVKTTIMVVASCYDAANNANVAQEKILGYFIYWPQADYPWIDYSGDMDALSVYFSTGNKGDSELKAVLDDDVFMIYPGREISAIAYHAQGVLSVDYWLYECIQTGTSDTGYTITLPDYFDDDIKPTTVDNKANSYGRYSTSFSWGFLPPSRSAYYVVRAVANSERKTSEEEISIFRVQDITYPDFPEPPSPAASNPLFQAIGAVDIFGTAAAADSIRISGLVSDVTSVSSLCLVWINPESTNYAAMSQLEYFRDAQYSGWVTAKELTPNGNYAMEGEWDPTHPNKVWRLSVTHDSEDLDTGRQLFRYSKEISLSDDLNISSDKQPLRSQVFLLRAENPDGKTTIITYTPQGDTVPPVIEIGYVLVGDTAAAHTPSLNSIASPPDVALIPARWAQLNPFEDGDTITIVGTWREDSTGYLNFAEYLQHNFEVFINQYELPLNSFTFYDDTPNSSSPTSGVWMVKAKVGQDISSDLLRDVLVVSVKLTDIGRNESEAGGSWLIRSDNLRLLRISSDNADQTYGVGSKIEIFIEFNKPVRLRYGGTPSLQLNMSGATATYRLNQTNQSTRQYFDYEVKQGDNTGLNTWLNVTGLVGGTTTPATSGDYAFTWFNVTGENEEEIRVGDGNGGYDGTSNTAGSVTTGANNMPVYRRTLPNPSSTLTGDSSLRLAPGKNIEIDTTPPTFTSINSSNPAGSYTLDSDIYINVTFSERVTVDSTNPPRLTLSNLTGTSDTQTSSAASDVKVNENTITFIYRTGTVRGATTSGNVLGVSGFTGTIRDLAGNALSGTITGTLQGGTANNGAGIFIDTTEPGVPLLKILNASTNTPGSTTTAANVVTNTFIDGNQSGHSNNQSKQGTNVYDLKNLYEANLWFAIDGNITAGAHKLQHLEYLLNDDGTVADPSWTRAVTIANPSANNRSYVAVIPRAGSYTITTRQIDRAGNISPESYPVKLNWDPGDLVTRIDSEDANGVYTNSTSRDDKINIDVHLRKSIIVTNTATVTLNVTPATVTTSSYNPQSDGSLRFTYTVGANHNTPTNTNLDVVGLSIYARDTDGVMVTNYISVPAAGNSQRLIERKEISVQTGELNLTGPTYARTNSGDDEWEGTITLNFNRPISKGSGEIIITQATDNDAYRLPAVLTESQASRYSGARNFSTYYTKGTNGFNSTTGAADTSAKYILNYTESTVVTPNNGGSAIQQLAYDFHQAEKVTLQVSSNDIVVSSPTSTTGRMVITLRDSNALQVLGATYEIYINGGFVQDSLGYRWPTVDLDKTEEFGHTFDGINRPFVRIDKKVNADRITAPTGSATSPALLANYSGVLQAAAKLDCRTPGSVIRYATTEVEHTADGTGLVDTWGGENGTAWRNTGAANTTPSLGAPNIQLTGTTTGTSVATNTTMNIGDEEYQGYAWRIRTASRSSDNNTNSTALYDEVAYRTVLTYQVSSPSTNTLGQVIGSGDQIWLRGGDAIGSSTTPGFPFTWTDDYGSLKNDARRAGTRLMEIYQVGTSMNTASRWRYVTWEINDNAYIEILLGKATGLSANNAWQYGASIWAKPRGGWAPAREDYSLVPGRHRWLYHATYDYSPGGQLNWSVSETGRINTAAGDVTYTQP